MKNINIVNIGAITLASCFFYVASVHAIVVIDSQTITTDLSQAGNQNLVEIAESTPDLSTFVQALNASGLAATLEGAGPYTVFAPSNEAFAALPQKTLQDLLKKENQLKLATLLKNHIAKGSLTTNQLNTSNINSLGGKPLHINARGSQVTVDNANVVQADLVGSNGVIQIIDTVLLAK